MDAFWEISPGYPHESLTCPPEGEIACMIRRTPSAAKHGRPSSGRAELWSYTS